MSSAESRRQIDTVREALARESLDPAVAFEWKTGEGRSLAQYSNDLGISIEEFLSAECIVDWGSGPIAKPFTEILEIARSRSQKPPRMIAVSAGYKDSDKRARLERALTKHSVRGEIEILDAFAHEAPIPNGAATYALAEHLFEHLLDEDVLPTLKAMVHSLAPGGKAIIGKYPGPKSAEEVGLPRGTNMHQDVARSIAKNPGVELRNTILRLAKSHFEEPEFRVYTQDVPSVDSLGKWYTHERIVIERTKKPA